MLLRFLGEQNTAMLARLLRRPALMSPLEHMCNLPPRPHQHCELSNQRRPLERQGRFGIASLGWLDGDVDLCRSYGATPSRPFRCIYFVFFC